MMMSFMIIFQLIPIDNCNDDDDDDDDDNGDDDDDDDNGDTHH